MSTAPCRPAHRVSKLSSSKIFRVQAYGSRLGLLLVQIHRKDLLMCRLLIDTSDLAVLAAFAQSALSMQRCSLWCLSVTEHCKNDFAHMSSMALIVVHSQGFNLVGASMQTYHSCIAHSVLFSCHSNPYNGNQVQKKFAAR